jgi:ABC-type amino acid transport substrate-binding protein
MRRVAILALWAAMWTGGVAGAAEAPNRKLIIGTKLAPPFAMKDADGVWSGISIDLWRHVAGELKLEYEFREYDLSGLLNGVKTGQADAAVADGKIDAFVYDAPLLKYLARMEMKGAVEVLPITFERQDYAVALPTGSVLREPINRVLLRTIGEPKWQEILDRYLGK